MKPPFFIFLVLISVLISACSEPYVPTSQFTEKEVVVLAEMLVGESVEMRISTTYSSDDEPIYLEAEDGIVTMSNLSPGGRKNTTLRETKAEDLNGPNIWFNDDFYFEEGDEVTITTEFSSLNLDPIFATTTAPVSGKILESEAVLLESVDQLNYNLILELSELEEDTYYHLTPYVTNNSLGYDQEYFSITETTSTKHNIIPLAHIDGILIDNSKADDRRLNLQLSTSDIPSFDPSQIYLTLRTVTKDYYEYHKTLTLQQVSQQGPFDAPIPSYTNIERGQGIFVAYTSQLDSVLVK